VPLPAVKLMPPYLAAEKRPSRKFSDTAEPDRIIAQPGINAIRMIAARQMPRPA